MMAAALPAIDLVYRRGRFQFSDSRETALYFFWFALSLAFWSAQALYARALYAAGDTLTPMLAGTLITLTSLPVYWALFRALSTVGLAIASDIGIAANTVALAWLLHRRRLVPLSTMNWREMAKAATTAVLAAALSLGVARVVTIDGSRRADALSLALVSLTWAAAVAAGLWLTRSQLPSELRRRKRAAYPAAGPHGEELSAGIEP
jgi:putative peptidoglycan lipid II flippase